MSYQEIKCNNPDEFWDLLDPRKPLGGILSPEESEKLLYRGQENENWSLMPSSLRNFDIINDKKISRIVSEIHVESEINDIKNFVYHPSFSAMLEQLIVSIDVHELFDQKTIIQNFRLDLLKWPSKQYYPLVSLAQHHGIKTCLLDWSSRSYIAAYFASEPHLWHDSESENIVVWVYLHKDLPRIQYKKLPLSADKNFHAQHGNFTLVEQNMVFGKRFEIETIDSLVPKDRLWKILLHKKFVPIIMRYCYLHKIDKSTVYASRGFDSVAESCSEKKCWEEMMGYVKKQSIFNDLSDLI